MAKYTRHDLETLTKGNNFGSVRHKQVIQDLLDRAHKNQPMSYAESETVCRFMELSISEDPKDNFDITKFEVCNDYHFKGLYLIYHNNLNGAKPARNFLGPISISQKQIDIQKLDDINNEWYPKVRKFNNKDSLLNTIASEFKDEFKHLDKLYNSSEWGYNLYKAKIKSISLHSKYVYLTVKAFFEENDNPIIINLNTHQIHIDKSSLVHILRGHYAGIVKQFDTGKSFHLDKSIKHLELPNHLKEILELIGMSNKLPLDQLEHIPIRYNGEIYSIWTKQVKMHLKGGGQTEFTRLQTFYPVTEKKDLDKLLNNFSEYVIDSEISIFINRINIR